METGGAPLVIILSCDSGGGGGIASTTTDLGVCEGAGSRRGEVGRSDVGRVVDEPTGSETRGEGSGRGTGDKVRDESTVVGTKGGEGGRSAVDGVGDELTAAKEGVREGGRCGVVAGEDGIQALGGEYKSTIGRCGHCVIASGSLKSISSPSRHWLRVASGDNGGRCALVAATMRDSAL